MSEPFSLTNHVSVVTGGNRGIGFGIATQLRAAGAEVAIWSRDRDQNALAVERLGPGARAFECDVTDEEQVRSAMAATVEEFGRLDSVFANAGIGGNGAAFVDTELADWRRVIEVNLSGVFLTLREAARVMVSSGGGGSLVVTSSVSTIHGAARGSAYAASKGALGPLVKALAVELARHGIRANAIIPGWIEVERTSHTLHDEQFEARVLRRVPARRWGDADDVGQAAVFLASPASSYITGTSILVDGGYTVF